MRLPRQRSRPGGVAATKSYRRPWHSLLRQAAVTCDSRNGPPSFLAAQRITATCQPRTSPPLVLELQRDQFSTQKRRLRPPWRVFRHCPLALIATAFAAVDLPRSSSSVTRLRHENCRIARSSRWRCLNGVGMQILSGSGSGQLGYTTF